jgi:hypothetical protein
MANILGRSIRQVGAAVAAIAITASIAGCASSSFAQPKVASTASPAQRTAAHHQWLKQFVVDQAGPLITLQPPDKEHLVPLLAVWQACSTIGMVYQSHFTYVLANGEPSIDVTCQTAAEALSRSDAAG